MARVRLAVAWLLALGCVAFAVVRVLGLERGYPLSPLVAYTPFAVAAAVVIAVVALALRVRVAALVALVVAVVLGGLVAPRALGGDAGGGGSGERLTIVTANVKVAAASPAALVALANRRDADVLSVQEVNGAYVRRLDAAGLRKRFPFRVVRLREGARHDTNGTALFTRRPIRPLPVLPGTSNAIARGVVDGVEVVAVHPLPPIASVIDVWRREVRTLPAATPRGRLRVLAGDFNATLDHAGLRKVIATGYRDAAASTGSGLRPTWPSGRRFPPPVTIDHVLADRRIGFRDYATHRLPGSDHRAVSVTLVLP